MLQQDDAVGLDFSLDQYQHLLLGQEKSCAQGVLFSSTSWLFCLSEMTNDCLAVLRMCCSSAALQALELLVSEVRLFKAFPCNNML